MADEPTPETVKTKVFDLDDLSLETTYANTTHIIVGEGDVTIYFGFQPIDGNNIPASDVKRIVLSHDSFMRMMEFWVSRYRLLETLYGGKPITLRNIDRDAIASAFDTMLGKANTEVKQDETRDLSADRTGSLSPTSEE